MRRPPTRSLPQWCIALWAVGLSFLLPTVFATGDAHAGRWMYRGSYFSEAVPGPQAVRFGPPPASRSAYRPAVVGTGFGFAARGGYRYNNIYLRSGQSTDLTIIREDWFDIRP